MNQGTPSEQLRLPRRQVLKWFAAVAATAPLEGFAQAVPPAIVSAHGYGPDPNLTKIYEAGDVWPLTMTPNERRNTSILADLILPADEFGPAASSLRVPDFIDEWVSAPYPSQRRDRKIILPGLRWLDEESANRFGMKFADLAKEQHHEICDELCEPKQRDKAHEQASSFFRTFTQLCLGAYYGTPEGWQAIGYVGNMPAGSFDGPPQEVLEHVGLIQTVQH